MAEKHHVAEAQAIEYVRLIGDVAPEPGTLAVSYGIFDSDRDLPDPDDTVTIVLGNEIIRGRVVEIVCLVKPEEAEPSG